MAWRLLGVAHVTALCTAGLLFTPDLAAQEPPPAAPPTAPPAPPAPPATDAPVGDAEPAPVDAQPPAPVGAEPPTPMGDEAPDEKGEKKKKKKKKDEPVPTDAATSAADARAPGKPGKKGKKQKGDRFGKVEVFGRIAFRAELERHETAALDPNDPYAVGRVDSFDLTVPLARLGASYQAPVKWLSAEVEIDVAEGLELLDAWVRARNENFGTRVGKFKVPFSAIELESSFTLPLARRGVVHDLLVDELEVAGRRPGAAFGARYRDKRYFSPSLVIGVFQGSVLVDEDPDDRDVELASEDALGAQSLVARAEGSVGDVTLGLNYEHRVGTDEELEPSHYWTFGADAVFDTELGNNGIRVWAEVMDGASWFEHRLKPADTYDAVFVMTRLIGAFRFGGTRREAFYVEPYGMFSLFEPDTDVARDLVFEEAIGVNVGLWKRARVGLEAEFQKAQPNFPERYFLGENADRKALVLDAQIVF
jgi:hypothetical protein